MSSTGKKGLSFFLVILFFWSVPFLQAQDWTYTVRPGDNLWTVSERYLSSMRYWRKLQELNHISDPKTLLPGTRLKIPMAWLKIQAKPVKVLAVSGEVFFQSAAGGKRKPLLVGGLLHVEDAVRTGANSSVTFVFADGSRLLLQADSFLEFDVIQAYGETGMVDSRIRLKKGRLQTEINPEDGPGTHFEIHSPGAITSVRGTELRVASDPMRGISTTEVLKGRVDVLAAGKIQSVPAGFGTVVKVGEPPSLPSMLLQAPNLNGLPEQMGQLPLRFIWPKLVAARGYRIQLSKSASFDVLSVDKTIKKAQLILSDLPQGSYVMRVSGIDNLGLEGFNALHRFVLELPPLSPKPLQKSPAPPVIRVLSKPPLLVSPKSNDVLDFEIPEFEWEAVLKANSYRFQVAAQAHFFSPLLDIRDFSKRKIQISQVLKPGVYYWRVAAAGSSGKYGLFSRSQTFKVRAKTSRLTLLESQIKETKIQVHWQGGQTDERFQVQLARDIGFRSLVDEQEFTTIGASLDRPDAGSYYLRVRAITPEGMTGEYSMAQSIEVPSSFCCSSFLFFLAGIVAIL